MFNDSRDTDQTNFLGYNTNQHLKSLPEVSRSRSRDVMSVSNSSVVNSEESIVIGAESSALVIMLTFPSEDESTESG